MFIAAIAALMGIGQSSLLVSLPVLVEQSGLSLSTWSVLIALGSVLFLPAAPFWGRMSDRIGPKPVVLTALCGLLVSFGGLLVGVILAGQNRWPEAGIIAGLALARVIYGCTVAGMVPAAQHWAIASCGEVHRLQAVTTISAGLSTGRLAGPLLAMLAITWHPLAPFALMTVFPAIALVLALPLKAPALPSAPSPADTANSRPGRALLPFLLTGAALGCTISLLQYTLSPLLAALTTWSTPEITRAIGLLLTLSAAVTLLVQLTALKKQHLHSHTLYRGGAVALTLGFALCLFPSWMALIPAMAILSAGAAMLVPAYTTRATQVQSGGHGLVAGYLAMSHTVGYGLAALLAATSSYSVQLPIGLCLGFAGLILGIAIRASR
ncbi:MFS transporter [Photobacterium sp. TY1-4]|uniref:MFS transporter n=1 Tax=Photobacterium sp. TY1-4 TaxID=2899122 RepID=UPI0021C17806|nr:MFS transporter [Photobacterium sp. TY1-4]